jgi:hypothetical protein
MPLTRQTRILLDTMAILEAHRVDREPEQSMPNPRGSGRAQDSCDGASCDR